MAFSITEMLLSETPYSGNRSRREHKYNLRGTDITDEELYDWFDTALPASPLPRVERPDGTLAVAGQLPILLSYDGRPISDIQYEAKKDSDPELYKITVSYEYSGGGGVGGGGSGTIEPVLGVDGIEFAFEVGPENELIKQSLLTVGMYPPNGVVFAPWNQRAINVQEDGSIDGTQIPDSAQQFSFTFTNDASFFSAAKRNAIGRARGKVNSVAMSVGGVTYAAGEVRFLGASGSINNEGNSTIVFRFGVRENKSNLEFPEIDHLSGAQENGSAISDQANGIHKEGWDYLWVYYGKGVDANGKPTKLPRGLYVERLLERTDLNALFS